MGNQQDLSTDYFCYNLLILYVFSTYKELSTGLIVTADLFMETEIK